MIYRKLIKNSTTIILIVVSLLFYSCENSTSPAETVQNNEIETQIKAVLDSVIENTHVPGLVAGIWAPNEGIDLVYTAGVSDLETNAPMDAEMIFRIASNTKTFAITVLLQLVDEGVLSLDDKLSKYRPDLPRADEVTIEMLTNMRSGIYNYVESENFWARVISDPTHFWTIEEIINFSLNDATDFYYFSPGTGFHYSNTNTIIIQAIVENLTGLSLESLINSRIINPLNLTNTTYLVGGTKIPGYHSKAYDIGDFEDNPDDISEAIDFSFAKAAGSMVSNIFDIKTYVEALTGNYFLSTSLQEKRLTCNSIEGSSSKYGIGLFNINGFYGHNGEAPGYTSLMVHSLEKSCTIVIWYNCSLNGSDPTYLLPKLSKLIYHDL